jgi:hypothetical protein
MGLNRLFIIVVLLLAFISTASSQQPTIYISNSADWQDVYSVMLYSSISDATGYFLVSTRHSTLLINQLNRNSNAVVATSSNRPYVVGYKAVLESRGFSGVEEIRANSLNLELARRLPPAVNDFIILDDSYGYNAISVAPYGALSKTYVLFANRRNINQVHAYLASRNVNSLIIYGQVDREVKERLEDYNPETINEGDRFLNNQKIVDKYQEAHKRIHGAPKKQAILTNGEFIEQEIMSGLEPVVFIGRANVPDQVRQYIKASDIDIGILIGNELIGSATFIRRELGISVFVKFAQSARQPASTISPVEDLDRFYLPRYMLELDVFRIRYNRLTQKIEVTYQNMVDLSAHLKGTITLRSGDLTQILGDEDAVFIDKSQFKTIIYDAKSDGSPISPMQGEITAEVFTLFGESKKSLEYTLRKTVVVETVDIADNSNIELRRVLYDKRTGTFLVDVVNTGEVDVFVDLELVDMLVNDELITAGAGKVTFIRKGASAMIEVPIALSEQDLMNNPRIRVRAYYGERERSLVNIVEGEFAYGFTGMGYITGQMLRDLGKNVVLYMPLIVIIILLILIMGMKKKCPSCHEVNNLRVKRCSKCGAQI